MPESATEGDESKLGHGKQEDRRRERKRKREGEPFEIWHPAIVDV
jgi:hypothetical protein